MSNSIVPSFEDVAERWEKAYRDLKRVALDTAVELEITLGNEALTETEEESLNRAIDSLRDAADGV